MPLQSDPEAAYQALIEAGEIKPDSDQVHAVAALQRLYQELIGYPVITDDEQGWLTRMTSGLLQKLRRNRPVPRGIYLYGGVGRGKSMLMDLFFSLAPIASKRRVHFHEFMLDIHARLQWQHEQAAQKRRQNGKADNTDDPIPVIAKQIAIEATLLCFDELEVTDIADAMVLTRLFDDLLARGVVVVATSNRPPDELYKNGLNRQRFLPFIALLRDKLELIPLMGPMDYRYNRLRGVETYYHPVNEETTAQLSATFFRLTDRKIEDRAKVPNAELLVHGRTLFIPKSARGVAVFSFKRLCENPLGAAEYLAIARTYHTVIVVAIPQLTDEKRDATKRFMTLIDALYDYGVKFLCSAAMPLQQLYAGHTLEFEFERTLSRLVEMQSEDYLIRGHGKTGNTEQSGNRSRH